MCVSTAQMLAGCLLLIGTYEAKVVLEEAVVVVVHDRWCMTNTQLSFDLKPAP